MLFETIKFGQINYKKSDVIYMVRCLLGFEGYQRFVIVSIVGQEPFKWLQSLDDPTLAFLMIDPLFVKEDYIVEVNPKDIGLLGAKDTKDIELFVMLTIPEGRPEKMSANLQGPIIINKNNLHGAQLVLGESNYDTRFNIFKELEGKLATA
jgi:flagellar assembly factor FliW